MYFMAVRGERPKRRMRWRGVVGVLGLVEDAVHTQAAGLVAVGAQRFVDRLDRHRGLGVVGGGMGGDQQVGAGGGGPASVAFGQPLPCQAVGEFVQVDGVDGLAGAAHAEGGAAVVEVVQQADREAALDRFFKLAPRELPPACRRRPLTRPM
jgi:hypothetical protein